MRILKAKTETYPVDTEVPPPPPAIIAYMLVDAGFSVELVAFCAYFHSLPLKSALFEFVV